MLHQLQTYVDGAGHLNALRVGSNHLKLIDFGFSSMIACQAP